MKKKSIDLKTLWDRHSKSRKVGSGSGSGSTAQPVRIDSEVAVPSVQPITYANESPVQIQSTAVEVVPEVEN
jgi:hypothetical protein